MGTRPAGGCGARSAAPPRRSCGRCGRREGRSGGCRGPAGVALASASSRSESQPRRREPGRLAREGTAGCEGTGGPLRSQVGRRAGSGRAGWRLASGAGTAVEVVSAVI
ncbi:unnamed protein product, partial [Bubo scandiacus]